MVTLRGLASALLQPIRSRGRPVAWTPEFMGLGNLLQLAMWAYDGVEAGQRRWIRSTPKLDPWLEVFPGLRSVVLLADEVRFTDRRVSPWSEAARHAGADGAAPPHEPVHIPSVERFLREVVLPGSSLTRRSAPNDDTFVVNVRRGDYYADPHIREQYGFDQVAYIRRAVEASLERDGSPRSFVVVSDDLRWCRENLSWLQDEAPVGFPVSSGPVDDFTVVSSARRMAITNSTFSYWAAHVSNVVHGDNHGQVWAPRFFDRTQNGGRSWLLDERWSIVEELDGGWGETDTPDDQWSRRTR